MKMVRYEKELYLEGLECALCAEKIEKVLKLSAEYPLP